jgi:hypothetical protein
MPMVSNNTITKQPTDKLWCGMRFTPWMLNTTDELSSPLVTYDPNEDLTVTNVTVSGTDILFFIAGGLDGKNYRFQVKVNVNNGEILVGDGLLKVRGR